MDHSANAKRYRNQAEECRAKSDLMRDSETKAQYSRMADAYDKLAQGQDDMAQSLRAK
ncbi:MULTISPECIES: hypothetical protein [Bradyrhizobium]|uniref:hypothetical protein n=1 Tax=Bradyrhizobium TaxID=374 RepID=UPI000411AEA2|nr:MULTISPECIES: hypothetical protein [Bradyrhizobium]QOG23428.1 hypothetical protein FOM02_45510 [Bradyrhizobium sp. SEMIA]UFW48552.1 hypothetical protein BaraCB756_40955 [Bradyrhizobium arachidis]